MRHAGSPDDGRAAVAANRLIWDQPEKHSGVYGGAFGSRVICVHAPRRLARRRAGRSRGQQADLKISLRSTPAVMVERLAAGSTIYGARAAQQLRSPTGRPRRVARKPSPRSGRPAIEGLKNNQSCVSSSGARPGDRAPWRESQAHGVSARRLRGKKQTLSPDALT